MSGSHTTQFKRQTSLYKDRLNPNRLKNTIKTNKPKKNLPGSNKEKTSSNTTSSHSDVNKQKSSKEYEINEVSNTNSQIELNPILKDQQQENNNTKNAEQQIQIIQTNSFTGLTVDNEGKTPVDPNLAKQKYKNMLSPYEISEINNFQEIYFIGKSVSKKNTNDSFDDSETFQYKAKTGDHLAFRYEILSKLGEGAFATVYKCFDHKTKEKVAIKILVNTPFMNQQGLIEIENMKLLSIKTASNELKSKELPITSLNKNAPSNQRSKLRRISSSEPPSLNSQTNSEGTTNLKHVVKMIDNFIFRNHICIVMEILGESLRDFMKRRAKTNQEHSKEHENDVLQIDPLPGQMVKLIAYQIMDGLASIHRKKIIHGDLKPENILFTNPRQEETTKKENSNENSNKNSNSDLYSFSIDYQPPQKITSHFTISFSAIDNFTLISQVKIIDFGSSCRQGEIMLNEIQNRFYRAPEVVLGSSYGPAADVWSAGCIIAEMFVGKPLFPATNDKDLLVKFIETLGAPPESVTEMQADFSRSTKNTLKKSTFQKNKFFGENGKLLNVQKQPVPMKTRLTSFLKTSDTMMIDFLTKCLEWDKNKRMSAAKLCKHPWISGIAKQKI